jgi:ribonuclease HII
MTLRPTASRYLNYGLACNNHRRAAMQLVQFSTAPKTRILSNTKTIATTVKKKRSKPIVTLPRTLEESVLQANSNVRFVFGIDEAGRGPLAGPVVVGGIQISSPETAVAVEGIVDSKKITSESQREFLYDRLIQSRESHTTDDMTTRGPMNTWAIAVVDAATIDEINILQATMLGMRMVASVMTGRAIKYPTVYINQFQRAPTLPGCFVLVPNEMPLHEQLPTDTERVKYQVVEFDESYYALIDGNKIPPDMPCRSEAIVKGDSQEYCIAAASILAKVTRDRIMKQYHEQYPRFNFLQHKGYPTKAHIEELRKHGPSPIHRLSFGPLNSATKAPRK